MRCSKCGEVISENQTFCLKCGAPLRNIPGLNELERELADSVDSIFQDETEEEEKEDVFRLDDDENADSDGEIKDAEDEFDLGVEIDPNLSLDEVQMAVNANRQKEEDRARQAAKRADARRKKRQADEKKRREDEARRLLQEAKKRKKRRIRNLLITFMVLLVLAGAGYGIYHYVQTAQNDKNDEESQEYYVSGASYYASESYAAALREFLKADEAAVSDTQKIKVKDIIWQTYVQMGNHEEDCCAILLELIELSPYNLDYYQELITLYQSLGKTDEMEALFESIEDEDIYNTLLQYRSEIPEVNYEDGDYDTAITIELTALEDSTIYYTVRNGKEPQDPTTSSTKYTGGITLDEEGTWYLKAIAVSSGGSLSAILSCTWTLDFGIPEDITVSPSNGTYTGYTNIVVESPSGTPVYYTIDGEDPTNEDLLYDSSSTRMEWGNHIYKFAAINAAGYSSNVVSVIYNCEVEQNYTYDETVSMLKSYLMSEGILENTDGTFEDGSYVKFVYVEAPVILDIGFYLIRMEYYSESGSKITSAEYAVEYATGAIAFLEQTEDGGYEVTRILRDTMGRLVDEEGNPLA
ncbi:MAG: chitobiase/beta-hexosaminidase C-terminal domain-containing protein [Lachnospiraceae bacterium]|nr:chitobiase/beta-hexosaminidase C-terminal domain-containing protein [Lachnospiraceae bacterium]